MTINTILFYYLPFFNIILNLILIATQISIVYINKPINSLLYLILLIIIFGIQLLLLNYEFFFVILIIVYLGGVAILFLSAVMTLSQFNFSKKKIKLTFSDFQNYNVKNKNYYDFFFERISFKKHNNNFNNIVFFFCFNLIALFFLVLDLNVIFFLFFFLLLIYKYFYNNLYYLLDLKLTNLNLLINILSFFFLAFNFNDLFLNQKNLIFSFFYFILLNLLVLNSPFFAKNDFRYFLFNFLNLVIFSLLIIKLNLIFSYFFLFIIFSILIKLFFNFQFFAVFFDLNYKFYLFIYFVTLKMQRLNKIILILEIFRLSFAIFLVFFVFNYNVQFDYNLVEKINKNEIIIKLLEINNLNNTTLLSENLYLNYNFLITIMGFLLLVTMIGCIVLLLQPKDKNLKLQDISYQYNKIYDQTVILVKPKKKIEKNDTITNNNNSINFNNNNNL